MFSSNYLWVSLWAILPVLMYSFLIYAWIPKRFISLKRSRRYLVAGLLSPMLIFLYHFLFPGWNVGLSSVQFFQYAAFAFIQVGMMEEITKYITFKWVSSERTSEKYDLPIAVMFYSMMASVGFAIVENITYLMNTREGIVEFFQFMGQRKNIYFNSIEMYSYINDSMMQVALLRAVSAVVMHMIAGVIMGYFLSKAHSIKYIASKTEMPKRKLKFHQWKYIIIAILSAAAYHGIYDFNLMLPGNNWVNYFHMLNIAGGLIVGKLLIDKLVCQSKELRQKLTTNTI